jgi:hypothetical protein
LPQECQALFSAAFFQIIENQFSDRFERFENPFARRGAGFKFWNLAWIEQITEFFDPADIRQVPLVVLDNERDLLNVKPLLFEIVLEVLQAFDIGVESCFLRIGNKDNTVNPFEDQLT